MYLMHNTEDLISLMITIHMVFDCLKNRLKLFSETVQLWPECAYEIRKHRESREKNMLFSPEEFVSTS